MKYDRQKLEANRGLTQQHHQLLQQKVSKKLLIIVRDGGISKSTKLTMVYAALQENLRNYSLEMLTNHDIVIVCKIINRLSLVNHAQDQLVAELQEHQEKLNKLMAQNDQFSSTNIIN